MIIGKKHGRRILLNFRNGQVIISSCSSGYKTPWVHCAHHTCPLPFIQLQVQQEQEKRVNDCGSFHFSFTAALVRWNSWARVKACVQWVFFLIRHRPKSCEEKPISYFCCSSPLNWLPYTIVVCNNGNTSSRGPWLSIIFFIQNHLSLEELCTLKLTMSMYSIYT